MPLGTEVGLGPGDIVLDGNPALTTERATAALPTFRSMSTVAKRLPVLAIAELFCIILIVIVLTLYDELLFFFVLDFRFRSRL